MSLDPALQTLVDRAAIEDLLVRYAHGVDRRDLAVVAACFTPDAAYEGSLGNGSIDIALEALRERMPRYRTTMHLITNRLIELHGDTATSETYALVYHRLEGDDEDEDFVVGVRYLDDLARQPDGWRIVHRRTVMELQRWDAVRPPPE
ncbi:MAG: nuclear transport factor 2 family protein [bacterium]